MYLHGRVLFVLFLLVVCTTNTVWSDDLPAVTVTADQSEGDSSLTTPTVESAQEKLEGVPGGTTLVREEKIREGFTRSLEEALEFTPGVFAQSRFGTDEVRLSIRGSGITQTFNARGVRILRDGLPISEADGNVRPQLIDTLNAQHIEVYRGANALEYGAAVLGGAINIVSPTGYSQQGSFSRFEFGSDNLFRGQASNGWVFGNGWDAYTSFTGIEQNGFRDNGQQETVRFYGNLGKRWNDRAESRIHIDWQDNNIELPGSLTQAQFEEDPTQANAGSLRRNSQRDFDVYRISGQHSVLFGENNRADFGFNYQYLDSFHPLSFTLATIDEHDASVTARISQSLDLFSRQHNFVYGGQFSYGDDEGGRFRFADPIGEARGSRSRADADTAWGLEFYLQDTFPISDRIDLIVGSQVAYAERRFSETPFSAAGVEGDTQNNTAGYFGFSPRLGAVMQLTENVQLFGNISRSFEPPTNGEFSETLDSGDVETLDEQIATTFEIGSRGQIKEGLNYELALYYADLNDEILAQEDPSLPSGSGETVTINADDTTHRGIEFGLSGNLFGNLEIAAQYTYTDLQFENDDAFDNNDIPGIPDHTVNLELLYRTNSGFYIGPTFQYASEYYVDFSNTVSTEAYSIYGAKAGYQFSDRIRFFVEAINLEDEDYVSNTGITALANDNSSVFNPGLDRSFFGGLEIKL